MSDFKSIEDINWSDIEIIPKEDILINTVKELSKKHEISFIEALEVIKYTNSELHYNLRDIKDALYEIDRTLMGM